MPEDKSFKELMDEVRGLQETLNDMRVLLEKRQHEYEEILKEIEFFKKGNIPSHTHKFNRIRVQDLSGGLKRFNSTPSHVAEEGSLIVYSVNSTSYFIAVKAGQTWRRTSTLTKIT